MDGSDDGEQPRLGLRERKKARTRALIQAEALRLFTTRGYDETSIEDIAEAAEVSPSTVFRYFPTKPDLVIYDDLDETMIEAYRKLPPDLPATKALREMFLTTFAQLPGEELEIQRDRAELIQRVPELRSAMLEEFVRTLGVLMQMIAERSGRAPDDDEVVALAGAVMGLALASWVGNEGSDWLNRFVERIDKGLEMLENGISL